MGQTYYKLTPEIAIIFDIYHIAYYMTFYEGENVPCVDNWGRAKGALISAMAQDDYWTDEEKSYRTTLNKYVPQEIYASTELLIP